MRAKTLQIRDVESPVQLRVITKALVEIRFATGSFFQASGVGGWGEDWKYNGAA